jgi:hypothetical protein
MIGKEEWTVEIGDPNILIKKDDEFLIKENSNNVSIFFISGNLFYLSQFLLEKTPAKNSNIESEI